MRISVIGAGAFGSALAMTWANAGRAVTLWGRNTHVMEKMREGRRVPRLPNSILPSNIEVSTDLRAALDTDILIYAAPMQSLSEFLEGHKKHIKASTVLAACKGLDLEQMKGPSSLLADALCGVNTGILTGPSFAHDLAGGLPTALTLAAKRPEEVQDVLSSAILRLYRTTDCIGADLGGALKNVIAIACGVTIGAGLGQSARSALMTRGFAEMQRLALKLGAKEQTLSGLSGFGDLTLTCTSDGSRNYRLGLALGSGEAFDKNVTVEGAATARAVEDLAGGLGLDMPICVAVSQLVQGQCDVASTLKSLLSRPLTQELS